MSNRSNYLNFHIKKKTPYMLYKNCCNCHHNNNNTIVENNIEIDENLIKKTHTNSSFPLHMAIQLEKYMQQFQK